MASPTDAKKVRYVITKGFTEWPDVIGSLIADYATTPNLLAWPVACDRQIRCDSNSTFILTNGAGPVMFFPGEITRPITFSFILPDFIEVGSIMMGIAERSSLTDGYHSSLRAEASFISCTDGTVMTGRNTWNGRKEDLRTSDWTTRGICSVQFIPGRTANNFKIRAIGSPRTHSFQWMKATSVEVDTIHVGGCADELRCFVSVPYVKNGELIVSVS